MNYKGHTHLAIAEVAEVGVTLILIGGPGRLIWPSWKQLAIVLAWDKAQVSDCPLA